MKRINFLGFSHIFLRIIYYINIVKNILLSQFYLIREVAGYIEIRSNKKIN